jgi:hypothetical protein
MSRRYLGDGLVGQFENLFVPNPIKDAAVPQELREAALARLGGRNHKWYVCAPEEGGFFTAVDFQTADEPAKRRLHLCRWVPGDDGQPAPGVEIITPLQFERPFSCKLAGEARQACAEGGPAADEEAGEGAGSDALEPLGGYIWDRRALVLKGATRDGQEFATAARNGCYLLAPPPGARGEWREFSVIDRHKRLLYGRDF